MKSLPEIVMGSGIQPLNVCDSGSLRENIMEAIIDTQYQSITDVRDNYMPEVSLQRISSMLHKLVVKYNLLSRYKDKSPYFKNRKIYFYYLQKAKL